MATPPVPIPPKTAELETRFLALVGPEDPGSGCRPWLGHRYDNGYGRFYDPATQRVYRAHRVAYAWKYGDPGDSVLDHLCHDPLTCVLEGGWCPHRLCVNPDHLEPTTRGENVRRGLPGSPLWNPVGNGNRTECVNGHEFSEENTYVNPRGERQCRTCLRAATDRYHDANRDEINRKRREARIAVVYEERRCEFCGEPFTPVRSTGRFCKRRECINARQLARK